MCMFGRLANNKELRSTTNKWNIIYEPLILIMSSCIIKFPILAKDEDVK